ncbi:hypothetical protein BGZ46_004853 [Entomortierella lignicola]|nr:hypothetical protein BGZ46_004853 [Entomortierella lignicola]
MAPPVAHPQNSDDGSVITQSSVSSSSSSNSSVIMASSSASNAISDTTSDSTSCMDLILTNETRSPRQKRNQSATPTRKRKKQAFVIHIKDSCTVNASNQDSFDLSESGLRLAFKKFQTTSAKLVLPGRDISTLLPEALSLNGIWWTNQVPLSMSSQEHILHLGSLRPVYSPSPNDDLQLLAFKVQVMLQSLQSEEQLMDNIQRLYGGSAEMKQAVRVWQRLVEILPASFQPHKEFGEMGFILTRLQCFLDAVFGQRSNFPVLYNIEHDSGNAAKSGHEKGVRSDFFVEVPCRSLSSVFNSEVVEILGEVKPPEKDRRECIKIQDFWKLIRMAKDEINSQILKGVVKPMVICIQVFGFQLNMYVMTMKPDDGLYILYTAAEGYLPRSVSDVSGTGYIISIFLHAKSLLQEFQDQLINTEPYSSDMTSPPQLQKFIQNDVIFPE